LKRLYLRKEPTRHPIKISNQVPRIQSAIFQIPEKKKTVATQNAIVNVLSVISWNPAVNV
jgi:hypothetical protein